MLLYGYIDESYNSEVFTLTCAFAPSEVWPRFEASWKSCLLNVNERLSGEGRRVLSRYHATDCASLKREFQGWTVVEQIEFTKTLIQVFEQHAINVMSYSLSASALRQEFPEAENNWRLECYKFVLRFLMLDLAQVFDVGERLAQGKELLRIALFHDQGSFNATALNAFNSLISSSTNGEMRFFTTIGPMSWEECVPLQAADMLAYESYRESVSRLGNRRPRRKSLQALLSTQLGGRSRAIDSDGIKQLRQLIDDQNRKRTQLETP